MRRTAIFRGILIAMVVSLGARSALEASTETWSGLGLDSDWTSNGNWSGAGGAGADDDLVFPLSASRKTNNNDFDNTRFHSIAINGPDYVIIGKKILLSAGIVLNNDQFGSPGITEQFSPAIDLDANQAFSGVHFALRLKGIIGLVGHTLTCNGAVIFDGTIAANGGFGTLVGVGDTTVNSNSPDFGTTNLNGVR